MTGNTPEEVRWDKGSTALIAFFTLTRLVLISLGDLKVEEAYYWNYSQHPALSYFDHPPVVAWLIGLSTWLFGNNPWAVRLPAVLLFLASTLLLARLSRQLFGSRASFYTVLLVNSVPALTMHSLYILPDAPLLFFWSLGLYAGWQVVSREQPQWWWLVGVATGLGLDSKYPALLIPLGIFLECFLSGRRKLALNLPMLGSAALAILLFLPVILWNYQHDFASIRFQGGERMSQSVGLQERLGSWLFQFGLLSPGAFISLFAALAWAWRKRSQPALHYLLCWTVPFLVLMVYVSFRRLVQINWPLPGYLGAVLLISAWLNDNTRPRAWLVGILGPAFLLSTAWWLPVALPIAAVNKVDDVSDWKGFGRRALALRQAMPDPQRTFLAGHGYQAASELAFTSGLPHLTLANNILGERALAFTFWESPGDYKGWDAIVANYSLPTSSGNWRERVALDVEVLRAHFERMEGPDELIVERAGAPLRRYQYYRCFNYQGP